MRAPATFALILALAPSAALAQTAPKDGTWTSAPRDVAVGDACPADMRPGLEQMAAQASQPSTTEMTWNGAFDPTQADLGAGQEGIEWTQVDDVTWDGTINLPQDGGQLGTTRLTLVSDSEITSQTTMSIAAMMAAQGQANPALEGCELSMTVDLTHGG
ncbi:hypothetical protein [Jannaschia marina]|uniref:hypothetical protein n=1 Tax=Jannaschia marina TaxID=2741674 RepID=UPI0015C8D8A7|nr:hypothetical protein [Jannaschia marina]